MKDVKGSNEDANPEVPRRGVQVSLGAAWANDDLTTWLGWAPAVRSVPLSCHGPSKCSPPFREPRHSEQRPISSFGAIFIDGLVIFPAFVGILVSKQQG